MTKINFDEPSTAQVNPPKFAAALTITAQGDGAIGIIGETTTTGGGAGVMGKSKTWIGVYGEGTETGNGVKGATKTGVGVHGESTEKGGIGVLGEAQHQEGGAGVFGRSKTWYGVYGESTSAPGVLGRSEANAGVFGESIKWYGVYGLAKPEHIGGVLAEGGRYALVARNGKFAAARIEGDCEVTGDIKMVNADCAEDFDIVESEENIEAGTVMVLDESGSLQSSYQEYDKKVAGIISGASGYKPAIVLDRQQDQDQNKKNKDRLPIALMGKVYCKVDARHSSIEMGDLLTTSSTKGYAMKAEDPMKAFGAVIGKALKPLKEGLGMIPVLVALQ